MNDLKHLTRARYFKRWLPSWLSKRAPINSFRRLAETKKRRRNMRFVLPIIALVIGAYPVLSVIKTMRFDVSRPALRSLDNENQTKTLQQTYRSFRFTSELLNTSQLNQGILESTLSDGGIVSFTVNSGLQNHVYTFMREKKVPYGVFVAIEPDTGKVLALTGYSSIDPAWSANSCLSLYPMASLFKIITASAALELKKVEPDTMFSFRGYSHSENPKYWSLRPGEKGSQIPLSLAMGKSINPVFGRLASDFVGKESIMSYVQRFGFNQDLFPGSEILPSQASVPKDDNDLKLMGAGLGRDVRISPLHAAVMIAAIANKGTMMTPILAQEIKDRNNKTLIIERPQSLRRLVTPETAEKLSKMLMTTVINGTSRRAFHDRRGNPKLASLNICAKTGSISGKEPDGNYTWFAAFAPAENPRIALVALVINKDKWVIKASQLGEVALEAFFEEKGSRRTMAPSGG
jgi:penicillin-binding protein A